MQVLSCCRIKSLHHGFWVNVIERGYNLCILGESDAGKSYLAKAIGIKACNRYNVGYFHSEELPESMVALKERA